MVKIKKSKELNILSVNQLEMELLLLSKERFNLKMKRIYGPVECYHWIKLVNRGIARINTILYLKKNKKGY
ncbi:50S ribosomal protein L29 [Candidatus Legionella polyplacis]|uniref:Large ribosomal subunit protein uL29 n=1 Tax=Candidatus Legionella polyplacis TaxID=2005262 RepID=A0ABZ2GW61_9GAMM|nr:50S ribosomal protein L29 [Candidatus Legionella polyplacis]ATW01759.1 50S ribosomal protein L29 [Candidatus Legionella polyplacis]